MIVFQNTGEIDVRSISTFGVSVKETENPIGFFGTGLKYAIAVLLRTGHKVTVHSGKTVVRFGVQREEVRGQEFEFVNMTIGDGATQPLGFTTELGKQWELWMAYREIACNCKDEGGEGRFTKTAPMPEPGTTQIIVEGDEFEAVFADSHLYILADQPHSMVGTVEIRNRRGHHLYYRGVRVMELARPSLYTYNMNAKLELTEDRTVKSNWTVFYRLAQVILESQDPKYIRACVTAPDETLEGGMDLHGMGFTPSQQFLDTVGEVLREKMFKVNPSAMRVWKDATKQEIQFRALEMSKVQAMSMRKAIDFCERMGFEVSAYPIKPVESLGEGILGLAQEGTIYVAERAFEMGGAKQLASTLIEEFLHLRHGWQDCTRELQTYLFEKVVSLGEELAGEPL